MSETHKKPTMQSVIWLVFALLALLWTAGIAVTAEFIQWAGPAMASGGAALDLAELVSGWPLPGLAALGLDPAALQTIMAGVLAGFDGLLVVLGGAAGWITPVLWLGWALGMALLLVLAIAASRLMAHVPRSASTPA